MVDDHVAQRTNRVVEVSAILDAELSAIVICTDEIEFRSHRRLQHGIGEPQVEDLVEPHLAEEVVDPEELRLIDVLMQLHRQRVGRCEVVSERLLDHHPGVVGEPRIVELLDHRPEQKRRDLEVEHRLLGIAHGRLHAGVGVGVGEVAADVVQPGRKPIEHGLVDRLAGGRDHRARVVAQVVDRPVIDRHADDRARQQTTRLQPVERM